MDAFLLDNQAIILSLAFYGVLPVIVLWETIAEFRPPERSALLRWGNNIGLGLANIFLERWAMAAVGFGATLMAQQAGAGLLDAVPLPLTAQLIVSVLILDCFFYLLHRLWHVVPWLWRIHRVHHTDTELDFSVSFRRHPLEPVTNGLLLVPVVYLLGIPPAAYVLFSAIRAVILVFEHANVRLPDRIDHWLRWLVITPAMHRIHHSAIIAETDSNFSDGLTWWDRLFGTYLDRPRTAPETMVYGLEEFREPAENWIHRMLLLPLRPNDRSPGP